MNNRQSLQQERAVIYRNKQFRYTIEGSGPVICMVPPPGMGIAVFDKLRSLANHYTIITPDFRGWEVIVCKPEESMIQLYVTLIKKIMEQEEVDKINLLGYSAGGTIVQAFCLEHRERVKAVMLAGAYPKVATKGLDLQYRLGLYILRRKPQAVIRFLGSAHARHKSFKKHLENKMMTSNIKGVDRYFKESYYYDCTASLATCNVPFLTIYGKHENWLYKHITYYEQLPKHSTVYIEKSLHQHPVRKPHVMVHIIRVFLKRIIEENE